MPNLSLNLKIANPIIKDSLTLLDGVNLTLNPPSHMKIKHFLEFLENCIKDLLISMNLSRFLVGSDYLLVTIASADIDYKLLEISRYKYKTSTEIIKAHT